MHTLWRLIKIFAVSKFQLRLSYSVNKIWASRLKSIETLLLHLLAYITTVVIDPRKRVMRIPLAVSQHRKRSWCVSCCQNTRQTTIWKNMGGPRETCASLSWCWWKGESSLEEVYNLYFHCVLHAISCKIISKESPNQHCG